MLIEKMEKELAKTRTANGAVAYSSTLHSTLDLFSSLTSLRNTSKQKIERRISSAFSEDKLTALKLMFWARDVRGGAGERETFKTMLKYMAKTYPEYILPNLHLIPEFGRWDDVLVLLETPLEDSMVEIIREQLATDALSDTPSLLAKWMPSANATSIKTKTTARKIIQKLNINERTYRKTLTHIRKKLNLVETAISTKNYDNIDYAHIPSKAGMKYVKAFFRNDEERYKAFLDKLTKGEVKVNSATLYPYEIVGKILDDNRRVDADVLRLFDGQWKNLPEYINPDETSNVLSIIDVSGSMDGRPIEVAISLGLYLAERTKGQFANKFMTFSADPAIVTIKGNTIYEKVKNISQASWGMSTDIEKAFRTILKTAVTHKVPEKEMPTRLIVISDMEFNSATRYNKSIHESLQKDYKKAGYEMPTIVYWNVNETRSIYPMTKDDFGLMVSGFSQSLFKSVLKNELIHPMDVMLDVLNAPRYEVVKLGGVDNGR